MKKTIASLAFALFSICMNAQTIWTYNVGSCDDPYDYCLEVNIDNGEIYYPVLNFRDTSFARIYPDTVQIDRLKPNYNDGQQTAFVGVNAQGRLQRCPIDSVIIPFSQVTGTKKQETFSGTTNGSGIYTVTFGTAYTVAPNIQANIIGGTDTQLIKITSVSTTGFTVTVVNRVDVLGLLPSYVAVNGAAVDVLITQK